MKKKFIASIILIFSFCYCFAQQPLYRYYDAKAKKHFYTTNFGELGNGAKGFALEGIACRVFTVPDERRGLVPVYRYVDPQTADHYYTIRANVLGQGTVHYSLEGPAFDIYKQRAPGTVPLFEYYNPRTADHFYTVDKSELGRGFDGYQVTTIAGYVFPPR